MVFFPLVMRTLRIYSSYITRDSMDYINHVAHFIILEMAHV